MYTSPVNKPSSPEELSELNETPSAEVGLEASGLLKKIAEANFESPQRGEMPFPVVMGEALTELPKDLYIPPQALEVILDAFEGPLDLLLYLVRKQNLNILDVDVSAVTEQYMQYVELMESMQFELAAEYLLMAAVLSEIKSCMLLPRLSDEDEEEEDPRANLIRRLQEYERFKHAAENIDELPRLERDIWTVNVALPNLHRQRQWPDVDIKDLLMALGGVLWRADMYESHHIQRESLSMQERMSDVLGALKICNFLPFVSLLKAEEGRLGVVVTFLALMELIKEALVEIVQTENFGLIHVKARVE